MNWQILQYGFGVFSSSLCCLALVAVLWGSCKTVVLDTTKRMHSAISPYEMSVPLPTDNLSTHEETKMQDSTGTMSYDSGAWRQGLRSTSMILALMLMTGCVTVTEVNIRDMETCVTAKVEAEYVPQ